MKFQQHRDILVKIRPLTKGRSLCYQISKPTALQDIIIQGNTMVTESEQKETRNQRRKRQNRAALLAAAKEVMEEKGVEAATVQEIAERADVALGTFYSYFNSKDEIVTAVIEGIMSRLGRRIRRVTDTFPDPGQATAYGFRTVMDVATTDAQWRWLMRRPDTLASTMIRMFGRYGMVDIRRGMDAGRYDVNDVELVWSQALWAAAATCVAICSGNRSPADTDKMLEDATVNILCLIGADRAAAHELAHRPRPPLPADE